MRLYNLFPLLAGRFEEWEPHLERAAAMRFDWIFVNPVQKPGASGSLYSIADYFQLNPLLVNTKSSRTAEQQLQAVMDLAEKKYNLRFMTDLVLNHCAIDSALVHSRPDWFVRDHGEVRRPFCIEESGHKVVWEDLAQFDHGRSHQNGLYGYFREIIEYYISLGFQGFRCDAAYQLSSGLWRQLIDETKQKHPEIVFAAETLGCSAERTKQTAQAGFDFYF